MNDSDQELCRVNCKGRLGNKGRGGVLIVMYRVYWVMNKDRVVGRYCGKSEGDV